MILSLFLLVVAQPGAGEGSVVVQDKLNPVAAPGAVVVSGHARFTVLTPSLIRMEWSPDGAFEDRASLVVVNRRLPVPEFQTRRVDGRLVIETEKLTLRYTEGRRFTPESLSIGYRLNGETRTWRPGMEDRGNLKGTCRTLDTVSGAAPLSPGLLSRDGWVVVDDSKRVLLDGSEWAWATPRGQADAIDWYFFGYGHDYKQALFDFTRVAGRIPLPPRFAFGSWWSRYWAYSDAELRALVAEFDEHDVPLDVLVVDMDWHLDGWTGYTWNPKYFPDPKGFLKWAHEQGLKVTLNLHPADGVKRHEAAFEDVARAMGLDPETTEQVLFDCTDRRYVDAYFKHLHHPLERQGVDFWWIDWQQGTETAIAGLDPLWWLNYLHWTDMERNPARGGRRPMMFSRWGGLGNHRYQVGFSGDTYCNWASLAFQPHFTATAGNVGYAYWSHDIGGHQPGPVEPELYARWIQWGALSPILRTHTTKDPAAERRIWKFRPEVFDAARQAYHLRYALIPYIYTAARKCYDTGLPLCRPLYYEWPELEAAYEHSGEYLFGDDLLVAPVVAPADPASGCAEVQVWLPPGAWTHWFSGRTYAGSEVVPLLVPLDEVPLFVRWGSIIPTQPPKNRTGDPPVDPLVLHVWPGPSGTTRVYEDDGATDGYRRGQGAWTPVRNHQLPSGRRVTIGPAEGAFAGMPIARRYEIRLRDTVPPAVVTWDGDPLERTESTADAGWIYETETLTTVVRLPPCPLDRRTEVRTVPARTNLAWFENLLRSGLRGQLRRMAVVAETLRDDGALGDVAALRTLLSTAGAPAPAALDALRGCGQRLMGAIADTKLDQNTRRRALTRLLALQCDLEVTVDAAGPATWRLSGAVSMSPPKETVASASGRLEITPPPNWEVRGPTAWPLDDLHRKRRIALSANATAVGPPQTAVVRWLLSLEIDGEGVEIPGERVVLPSVNRWWVAGPFSAEPPDRLAKVFPPETGIDLKARYAGKDGKEIRWKKVERSMTPTVELGDEFFVNLLEVFGRYRENSVAYALTYLHAPRDLDASLAFGSDDGIVIWLNGQEIHRHEIGRPYTSKEDRIPLRLKSGANSLLLKISQHGGGWGFGAHVETPEGRPLTAVTVHLSP